MHLAAVQGEWVALDRNDAVAGRGQRQDELAVTGAYDRDATAGRDVFVRGCQELGEEAESVLPQARCPHDQQALSGVRERINPMTCSGVRWVVSTCGAGKRR